MPFTFVDRVPSKLGRVKITPENGGAPYYAVVERADEPAVAGTPLSAANLNAAQEILVFTNTTGASTWKGVYIATNGNDANSGTQASPMATIKAAIRRYAKWHKTMDIYLQDGVYTEDVGAIATDQSNVTIRSTSSDMNKVTLNMATTMECHTSQFRLMDLTINMTADGQRAVSTNAGQLYAYRVRFNMPAGSTGTCVNAYNGASVFLSECIINAGAGAAVYGNQALHIRAYNCTSAKTIPLGCYANNGTVIEYTPTITATTMTREENGGKCVDLSARPGSVEGTMASAGGQYATFDGLLLQWGSIDITPTAANTATTKRLTFPIKYAQTPLVFTQVVSTAPEIVDLSVMRSTVSDQTAAVDIILTRSNIVNTFINWFAIGPA